MKKTIALLAVTFFTTIVDLQAQGLIPFSQGSLYGYKDVNGNIVVNAEYDAVSMPAGAYGTVCKDHVWGLVDASGRLVLPLDFGYIDLCSEGVVAAFVGTVNTTDDALSEGYWGYVDLENPGEWLLYGATVLGPFIDSVAWVNDSGPGKMHKRTMPIVDKKGKVIGDNIILGVSDSFAMRDLVAASDDGEYPDMSGKWVLYNRNKQPISTTYEMVGEFHNGVAWVKRGGKYGFVNKSGQEVIPAKYISVQGCPEAKPVSLRMSPESGAVRWVMNESGQIAWFNEKGELVIDFIGSNGKISIHDTADERMWDF